MLTKRLQRRKQQNKKLVVIKLKYAEVFFVCLSPPPHFLLRAKELVFLSQMNVDAPRNGSESCALRGKRLECGEEERGR